MRRKPPLEPGAARGHALRALGRREHSARELEYKLTAAGLAENAATEVVEELGAAGWQSDERYADLLTRARIAHGYGPLRIRAELSSRGVAEEIIDAALERAECDWDSLIRQVSERRYDGPPSDAKEHGRRYRFLASRGFTSEQIRLVLRADPAED